ncbi:MULTISPECIES: hypothetical protein [unclassified Streptomyces]|uniref:hypothetical protein n=1 Tax=unclassified Streptomyces TaxID=2593676 RepID=UPI0035DF1110
MSQIRLMDSDPGKAERTAAAVQRALEGSPEVVVGNVATVPNKRGPGARIYMEVLLLEARGPAAAEDQEVTVERADGFAPQADRRRPLPRGGLTLGP